MKDLIFAAGTVCALLLVSGESSSPPRQRGFLKRTIAIGAEVYHYQVFLPFGWQPQKTWPVVLFLHGNGERGDDGWRQTRVGIGPAIRRDPERVPAVVVLPQCRRGMWWTHAPMERLALAALEAAIQEFGGDPARVFLTGISMGGYGTWSLAAKYPGKFCRTGSDLWRGGAAGGHRSARGSSTGGILPNSLSQHGRQDRPDTGLDISRNR